MSLSTKVINKLGSLFSYKCLINQRITGLHQSAVLQVKKIDVDVPEKPKRPLSTYIRFVKTQRPLILENQPNLSPVEVVRMIAKQWSELNDEVKLKMLEEFRRDQEEFRNNMNKYNESLSSEQQDALKYIRKNEKLHKIRLSLKKKKETLKIPKRPPNPFVIFVKEHWKNAPKDQIFKDFLKESKNKWSLLSRDIKENYFKEFANLNEQYKKDLAEWEHKMISDGELDVIRKKNLSRKRSDKD